MTSLWGPLGWMTLHSVSMLYPEQPGNADKQILKRYMELFRDSLSCPHCHQHFKTMFANYTRVHPEWNSSRFAFFLFVCRVHNTVNRRLQKPKPDSVQACLDAFQAATQHTSSLTYRMKYLDYLARNWSREMTGEAFMHLGEVREMRRITEEYWNTKTDDSTSTFDMSADVLESVDETPGERTLMTGRGTLATVSSMGINVGFRGGRFRLTKG
jgi:hypothetical protein